MNFEHAAVWKDRTDKEPQLPTRGDSRKPESKINIRLCHEPTQEAAAPVICDEFRELENRMALNRCYM